MKTKLISLITAALAGTLVLTACSSSPTTPTSSTKAPSSSSSAPAAPGTSATPTSNVNEDGTVNDPTLVQTDPNKLVFWSLFSGGDGAWMDKIIQAYNGTSPQKQVQSVMLVWADYYTKLMTGVAAGKGPDIGVSHVSNLPMLVAQGVIQPIDDYAAAAGIDWTKYPANSVAAVTFDGKHYALPLDTHAEIMYVNKDMLAKAGVQLGSDGLLPVKNADEFKAILAKLKPVVGDGNTALSLGNTGDDTYRTWWATYFQMGGKPILSDDGKTVTLDKDIAIKAADFVKSLYTDGYIQPGITDHQKFFQDGKAGIVFAGTWATGVLGATDGLKFVAQPFPSLFGSNDAQWADSHTLTLPTKKNRSAADAQAAVNFMNYVSTTGALTWASSGQIPSDTAVTASGEYQAMPYRAGYMAAAKSAVFPPQTEYFAAMKSTMITNLDTIWTGQKDSATAIANMIDELDSDIKG